MNTMFMVKCIFFILLFLWLFNSNEQNIQLISSFDSIYNVHSMLKMYAILDDYFRLSQMECLCKPYSMLDVIQAF